MNEIVAGPLVTREIIEAGLLDLGVKPGMSLIVHSSLSSLGWVCGGAVAVILALENVLTIEGSLVMPAQSSDFSEPARWQNPPVPEEWWETIRETMPAFDKDLTPTGRVGVIPETFRKQAGVIRSNHPAVSFVAWGKHASFIVDDHHPETGLGYGSPLEKLYELDGHVLLLGAGNDKNTSLHLAEYRANLDSKRYVTYGNPVYRNGKREWMTYEDLDYDDSDFAKIGEAFEAGDGNYSAGKIGSATVKLYRQRPLVDFATGWMEKFRREE